MFETPGWAQATNRLFTGSMVYIIIRCTLRYLVLPLVLPQLGLSDSVASVIALIIDVLALATIWLNVRQRWHASWRWYYFGLGVVMTVIIAVFMSIDTGVLLTTGLV